MLFLLFSCRLLSLPYPVLSCFGLSCLVLSRLVFGFILRLSCGLSLSSRLGLVLSFPVVVFWLSCGCVVLSRLVLSRVVLLALHCLVCLLPCLALSLLVQSHLVSFCLVVWLSCPVLVCLLVVLWLSCGCLVLACFVVVS